MNCPRQPHPRVGGFGPEPIGYKRRIGGKRRETRSSGALPTGGPGGHGPACDRGIHRVRLTLELRNVTHQVPGVRVIGAGAVDPGVESKLTGGKLPIERFAALKLGGECPPNGGGVLLRGDVAQGLGA